MVNKLYIDGRQLRSRLKQLLYKAEVDRAVFFGLLSKAWGMVVTPITALLIATRFTPELQGYYYTFANLLAMQLFIELGFGTVIVQFASHEWSKLGLGKDGNIEGDKDALSRLISLAQFSLKWYLAGGVLLTLGLGISGSIFFSQSYDSNIKWGSPWLILCLFTGITVCLVPIWSLLEGCNQVKRLYAYRFWQNLFVNSSIWIALLFGAELWTASVGSAITLVCAAVFLKRNYWTFLKTLFFSRPTGSLIKWRRDIFPMQWRFALSWMSGYFISFLFTPVLFHYHGPVVAGQFGMTWSLLSVIGSLSGAWLAPKVPQFGILIALKNYVELDQLFWRLTRVITYSTVLSATGIWIIVYLLNEADYSLAVRLLPPLPTGIFLLAQVIIALQSPVACYLRAHKREPLLSISVIGGILIGLSTFVLGRYYSATGMAIGYLVTFVLTTPFVLFIWYRCRVEWHKE